MLQVTRPLVQTLAYPMPGAGIEPARAKAQRFLRPPRLPISPSRPTNKLRPPLALVEGYNSDSFESASGAAYE